jgi:hypothetical protein
MATLLQVIAPVFGIMLLGFVSGKLRVLDAAGVRGLVLFVFTFAIPVLLFEGMAEMELPDDVAWGFLVAFYVASFVAYGLGMAVAVVGRRLPLDEAAIHGMGGGVSNAVLLGIPVVLTAFGEEASLPLFLIIGFHSATFLPLTIGLIQLGRGGRITASAELRALSAAVLRNPIIVGLAAGLVANLAGVGLAGPVERFVALLGASAVPCALFAMGATLAEYPIRGMMGPALALAAVKLVVHPALVWVLAVPVLGLGGLEVEVAVVVAAMPSAVNVYLFGSRYRAAEEVAARTVFLTSALSAVTVSVLLVAFGG